MANNYLHPGEVLDYTATRDTPVGSLVIIGALAAVALTTIPAGHTGSVRVTGVFALPKAADSVAAQGARAFIDGNGQLTAEAGENAPVGVFAAPAVAGALTCRIKLNVGGA
ncbi:MAG: capsid cement protein [Lysobacteraceae bacterium]|jgi:predicted RecA/RadA family phage recombinase